VLQAWLLLLLTLELAFYIWAGHNLREIGYSWWVVGAFVVVVAFLWRLSHALGSFMATSFLRFADDRPIFIDGTADAVKGEFFARLTTFNLSQPMPQIMMPREPVMADGVLPATPILLVHGYFCNRGLWVQFVQRLAQARLGPIYTINCGPPLGDIELFASQLRERIDHICEVTGSAQINVVAHSMGGLTTRAYLRACQREGRAARIENFITIATPHHGTKVSTFGIGRCTRQMRWLDWGNRWLSSLAVDEKNLPKTLSIYTENDDIVYPSESSRIDWGDNVMLHGVGHVGMLFDERVMALVVARLRNSAHATA
jgi:pimeloyl-ACP methyl ester carboxylesterase